MAAGAGVLLTSPAGGGPRREAVCRPLVCSVGHGSGTGRSGKVTWIACRAPAFSLVMSGSSQVMSRPMACCLPVHALRLRLVSTGGLGPGGRGSWGKSRRRTGSSATGPSFVCWMRTASSRRSVRSRRLPTAIPPRGSRRNPGTTPIGYSRRLTSSGSGAGSRPSCRSLNGPPGVIYTRPCSGFAMVPSGQPGRISWRRCWSR